MLSGCDFVAGWVGGVTGITIGHPFDTLKVRQQIRQKGSLFNAVQQCYSKEGIRGFYKGISYPLLSAGAQNAIFFGCYGTVLNLIAPKKELSGSTVFCAGVFAGLGQLFLACPVDLVKIKLQIQTTKAVRVYKGPFDVISSIYRQEGIRGCYRGLLPMLPRDCLASGVYMYVYFKLTSNSPTPMSPFWAGGLAGVISWLVIMPLDVVKSRVQADPTRYKNAVEAFKCCLNEGGIRLLFRGSLAVSLRAFPLNGATFVGWEDIL